MGRVVNMEVKRISDICLKVCSGGTPTSSVASYYDGEIPWLNTNEVNFCNIYSTAKHITEEGLKKSAAKYIPENTIIVAMYGVTAGRCAVTKIPLTTNQACCNLVIDETKAHYQYVYYFLKLQSDFLNSLATGGAQQNLNALLIKNYSIMLPSLSVQHRIASILSNYDTLIDTNTKRIKLLEESARELYKEWFVRMRFPGYEQTKFVKGIPENWKIGYLKDIATLLSQKVKSEEVQIYVTTDNMLKDFKGVDYKELTNKPEGKVCYFEKGDILMSNIRPYFKKLWYANQQGGCSADVLIFRANKDIDTHFLFYTMCTDYFIDYVVAGSNGTKMPRGNKVFTMNFPVLVPSKELMGLFRENVSTIYSTIETLQLQNQTLASTRDRLLPRLLSGELKVKA